MIKFLPRIYELPHFAAVYIYVSLQYLVGILFDGVGIKSRGQLVTLVTVMAMKYSRNSGSQMKRLKVRRMAGKYHLERTQSLSSVALNNCGGLHWIYIRNGWCTAGLG